MELLTQKNFSIIALSDLSLVEESVDRLASLLGRTFRFLDRLSDG
jgi:hypothetical protein